jgi:hypothetical protein
VRKFPTHCDGGHTQCSVEVSTDYEKGLKHPSDHVSQASGCEYESAPIGVRVLLPEEDVRIVHCHVQPSSSPGAYLMPLFAKKKKVGNSVF